MKVLIYGYYGTSNTGSDARLNVIINDIKKVNNNAKITVAVMNEYDEKVIPNDVKTLKIPFIPIISTIIIMFYSIFYDIIINGEGIPYTDFCGKGFLALFLPVLFISNLLGKKTVSYSFDIDHLTKLDAFITKKVLKKTDLLIARTKSTKLKLERDFGLSNVYLGSDCAYLFNNVKNVKKKNTISISIKDFFCYPIKFSLIGDKKDLYRYPYYYKYHNNGKEKYNNFVKEFSGFIKWLSKDYHVNLIVMEDFMDKKINLDLIKHLKDSKNISFFSSSEYNPFQIKKILTESKIIISSRLHALILSTDGNVPFIGISNDERIHYFFKEYNLEELCLDYFESNLINKLKQKINYIETNYNDISKIIEDKTNNLKTRADKNHKILKYAFHS